MNFRSAVYDMLLTGATKMYYVDVLEALPEDSVLIDVGIGTGSALLANFDTLKRKNIRVVGVDYDKTYVDFCKENVIKHEAQNYVDVIHSSIYDFSWPCSESKFAHLKLNYGYFSNSLMIMPDPVAALTHVLTLLENNGEEKIFTSQTFETSKSRIVEIAKPLLKYITSVDFGQVTYESDFMKMLEKSQLKIHTVTVVEPAHIFTKAVVKSAGRIIRTYALERAAPSQSQQQDASPSTQDSSENMSNSPVNAVLVN
eukprot:GDKJ01026837.1.p1 GENE.GDKJ01026837.1~~GDKJ01026837.1.p1  ORF type:complete len:267 (+),score=68.62 GDKJ01026837.1:35-802(+)